MIGSQLPSTYKAVVKTKIAVGRGPLPSLPGSSHSQESVILYLTDENTSGAVYLLRAPQLTIELRIRILKHILVQHRKQAGCY